MIFYLTYNDQPSGVYWSQVTDVVHHLNSLGGPRVRLLALVSARDFRGIRRKIRAHAPDALVLPMVPRMRNWRANSALVNWVCRRYRPTGIMARGVLATWMALRARQRGLVGAVCLDARGAYAAEWEEYRLINDDGLIGQFREVEREAVLQSDVRLAVSRALVDHWRERYGYQGEGQVVIPCTLGASHLVAPGDGDRQRERLGYGPEDVVLAYAGSTAGWQSFNLLRGVLEHQLSAHERVKVLFLCPPDEGVDALTAAWPGRVRRTWVAPAEVHAVLEACDAALLVREDTITNRVASPTKFAEYLSCGLPVIISAHIGDFSGAVESDRLGVVLREGQVLPPPARPTAAERERLRAYAMAHFTKAAHNGRYRTLLDKL